MAPELISLSSEVNVCENLVQCTLEFLGSWILQGQLLLPQAHVCSLVSCLSLDVSSCILWSDKMKCLALLIRVEFIFMLCLLLQYSREGTLPWKLLVPQRPAKMSPKHGFLSLERGIKFTSGVYNHWFLERFIRDMSLVLYAWIRSENSVYYVFCTAFFKKSVLAQGQHIGAAVAESLVFLLLGPGSAWQRPSWPGRAPACQGCVMSVMCSSPAPGHWYLGLLWHSGPFGKCKCCSFASVLFENRLKNYI